MRHETYRRLIGEESSIRALLAHPESGDVTFEPPRFEPMAVAVLNPWE